MTLIEKDFECRTLSGASNSEAALVVEPTDEIESCHGTARLPSEPEPSGLTVTVVSEPRLIRR